MYPFNIFSYFLLVYHLYVKRHFFTSLNVAKSYFLTQEFERYQACSKMTVILNKLGCFHPRNFLLNLVNRSILTLCKLSHSEVNEVL
jgi:hypothetical protein